MNVTRTADGYDHGKDCEQADPTDQHDFP